MKRKKQAENDATFWRNVQALFAAMRGMPLPEPIDEIAGEIVSPENKEPNAD